MMEVVVFAVAAAACLAGAVGVVASPNPVHAALSLVGTLFGIAVLFVAQEAHFLAAVQVIVYAGAIVVLFLFVIMLLGVDRADNLRVEPLVGQRVAAAVVGLGIAALTVAALASTDFAPTGVPGGADPAVPDIERLSEALFTEYVYALEITSVLLVIAVVGAVLLARRARPVEEIESRAEAEREAEIAARMERAELRAGRHAGDRGAPSPDGEAVPAAGDGVPAAGGDGPTAGEEVPG
ncbi:MAG TPA: NADH-quinone oxidoreductase subunit J [Acidimicrobiales bacterium]